MGLGAFRRKRMMYAIAAPRIRASTPAATPAPIPAFSPVESPSVEGGGGVAVFDGRVADGRALACVEEGVVVVYRSRRQYLESVMAVSGPYLCWS